MCPRLSLSISGFDFGVIESLSCDACSARSQTDILHSDLHSWSKLLRCLGRTVLAQPMSRTRFPLDLLPLQLRLGSLGCLVAKATDLEARICSGPGLPQFSRRVR